MIGMGLARMGRRVVGSLAYSKRSMSGFSLTAPKTLNEIAKVDMLEQETPEAVKTIWAEFHQDPSLMAIATSMPGAQHDTLLQRVAKCPHFIFPVFASKEAYYLMFSQFQDDKFFLTYLEDYRNDPARAQPYMTIAMFDDLKASKDLCLHRADHLPNLQPGEAEVLQTMVTEAYLDDAFYEQHIHAFTHAQESFDFEGAVTTLYTKTAPLMLEVALREEAKQKARDTAREAAATEAGQDNGSKDKEEGV